MSVEAIVLGAGLRGRGTFGAWALAHPERLRVVGLAEPDAARRSAMAAEHRLPEAAALADWRDLLAGPRRAPAAIIATSDTEHVEPALAALEAGYHVLLEKPIAPQALDCIRVVEAAERAGRILQVGHVLRHSSFYSTVHDILVSGRLGELVSMDLKEHVAWWHMTHSYVRGKFRKRSLAAPLLLAKSCHDLDLMVWLSGSDPARVASFGSLGHFTAARAPQGAPERCTDGCPVQAECLHDAERFYLGPDDELARLWPWADVSPDPSRAARRRALETGRYGRCVYRTDNDALDRQVVAVEFESGLAASFTVHGLASRERRTLQVTGSRGELRGVLHEGVIELRRHGELEVEELRVEGSELGHFGGDEGLVACFVESVSSGALGAGVSAGRTALAGHLLGFAAERARETGAVVALEEFRRELRSGPTGERP